MTRLEGQRADVAVVIAAGGAGVRLGPGTPKALRTLAGEPLLAHAVRGILGAGCVGCIVVAAPPGETATVNDLLVRASAKSAPSRPGNVEFVVVTGGAQRQDSVRIALAAAPAEFPIVLVHDAARALTPTPLFSEVAAAVRAGAPAVIPVLPVTDTIAEVGPTGEVTGSPPRSALRAVQTPQGFDRQVLAAAHAAGDPESTVTDDAGLVARLGVPVQTVAGSPYAMKITTGYDLLIAQSLLADRA